MNFFMIWLSSTVVSVYTIFNQIFKMIKEYADEGYIINPNDVENANNSMPEEVNDSSRLSIFSMFVPIYNLFFALMFVQKYESNKDMIFMYLKSLGVVREMEPFELNEYKKDPSLFNYVKISEKYKQYLEKSFKITINDRNSITDFYCIMENGNLRIVKTDGFYSRYTEEEQMNILCSVMIEFFKKIGNTYDSVEEFAKSLNGEKSIIINLEHNDNKEVEKESSVKDKYVKLRDEIKHNKELYDAPIDDNNKSLRLE